MSAQNPYQNSASTAAGPSIRLFAVSPSDVTDMPFVTTGLYIGTGGNVAVQDLVSGATVVFKNVGEGAGLPIRTARVLASGTTASDIVGMA